MDKPWLKSYPEGVSPNIETNEFSSLVDMFEKTCDRFPEKPSCVISFKSFEIEQR